MSQHGDSPLDAQIVDRFIEEMYERVGPKYQGVDTPVVTVRDMADVFLDWQRENFPSHRVMKKLVAFDTLSAYFRAKKCFVYIPRWYKNENAYIAGVTEHVPRGRSLDLPD